VDPTIINQILPIYDWIVSIMVPWGFAALFLLALVESVIFIGLIAPGEVVVVGAAFVASSSDLPIALVFVLAYVGSVMGIVLGYTLGRWLGFEGLRVNIRRWNDLWADRRRLSRILTIDEGLVDDTVGFFKEHGMLTVFGSRFAAGAKGVIPPIAGAAKMRFRKFLAASALGGLIYTAALVAMGWFIEYNIAIAEEVMRGFGWFGAAVLVVLLVFAFIVIRGFAVRRRRHYMAEKGFDVEDQTTIGERLVAKVEERVSSRTDKFQAVGKLEEPDNSETPEC